MLTSMFFRLCSRAPDDDDLVARRHGHIKPSEPNDCSPEGIGGRRAAARRSAVSADGRVDLVEQTVAVREVEVVARYASVSSRGEPFSAMFRAIRRAPSVSLPRCGRGAGGAGAGTETTVGWAGAGASGSGRGASAANVASWMSSGTRPSAATCSAGSPRSGRAQLGLRLDPGRLRDGSRRSRCLLGDRGAGCAVQLAHVALRAATGRR